jgi:hypothetical protein
MAVRPVKRNVCFTITMERRIARMTPVGIRNARPTFAHWPDMPANRAVSTGVPSACRVRMGSAFEQAASSPWGWRTLETRSPDSGSVVAATR